MTDQEKAVRLAGIWAAMAKIQQQAEIVAGHVLALEAAGMEIPAMRETAQMLAQVALGWGAPAAGIGPA